MKRDIRITAHQPSSHIKRANTQILDWLYIMRSLLRNVGDTLCFSRYSIVFQVGLIGRHVGLFIGGQVGLIGRQVGLIG